MNMSRKQIMHAFILLMIIGVALIFRMQSTDFNRPIADYSDSSSYDYAARNLIKYGVLTNDRDGSIYREESPVMPASNIMPGLPIFMSGVYSLLSFDAEGLPNASNGVSQIYWVQIVLSIIILLLLYLLMWRLGIPFFCRAGALFLTAVYPAFCYNLDLILAETLFTALFLTFAVVFVVALQNQRVSLLYLANPFLMAAVMVRAQALPFLIVECFLLLLYSDGSIKQKLKRCLPAVTIALIFLIPLWVRNWMQFQEFWILAAAGNGPKVWGAQPYFLDMASTNNVDWAELQARNIASGSSTYWKWRLFGFLQFMWGDFWDETLVHPQRYLYIFRLIQPFVIVPALAGIPFLVRKCKAEWLFICSIPLLFTLMAMPFHGLPRYVFPATPFLFVIAVKLFLLVRKREKRQKAEDTLENDTRCVWTRRCDKIFRTGYFAFSVIFSIVLVYSVFVFPWSISKEMSNYRLGRTYGISYQDVERLMPYDEQDLALQKDAWYIDNVIETDMNKFQGSWDSPPIMHIDIKQTENLPQKVVTKVEIDIPGGFLYDVCTIYWTGKSTPELSENTVYGRFPRNYFSGKQVVYIDDDVSHLMVVPAGYRGGKFAVNEIRISKFEVIP